MKHLWNGSFAVMLAVYAAAAPSGEEVYKAHCAACHDQNTPRIPPRDALRKLPATRILRTLDFGLMMNIAYTLKRDEREAVAGFLGLAGGEPLTPANTCPADKRPVSGSSAGNWNGWSPSLDNARYVPTEKAGINIGQMRNLKLKWAFGLPDDITAFGAPTVFNGTLFTGSAAGIVYALDAKTGCTHWVFEANGPVRMAILAVPNGAWTSLIFGDQIGWVYSLDAVTGKQLWRKRVEDHEATRLTGFARRARRRGLHPRGFLGGNALARSAVPVLHLPRQSDSIARARWVGRVEIVPDRCTREDRRH